MNVQKTAARQAFTVLEVTVALGLLAAGLALVAQMFMLCTRQHLAGEQLVVAQWEAANVLEHLAAQRYDEVTEDAVKAIKPSSQLESALPGASMRVTLTPSSSVASSDNAPPSKRIQVDVTWPAEDSTPRTVSLTAWKYPTPQEAPR